MKKTVLPLLLTLLLMLTALTANAQNDVRLSMEFNNEDLPSALARLEKNSSYRFLFTYEDLEPYRKRIGIHVLPQKTDQERRLAQFC
jgi:hypothetical protein